MATSYFYLCFPLLASRMTLLYFALSGLDLLNTLDSTVLEDERRQIVDWIYAQQVLPDRSAPGIHIGLVPW